jgi:hypothetical protein
MKITSNESKQSISATRIVASTLGAIVGLAGLEHGFFEVLQGNAPTNGLVIDAIGPAQKLWLGATEPAFTIIPTFFISGILAMIIGTLIIVWAVAFIQRKHGGIVLLLLSILLFMVGGGSPPIFLGVIASLVATRINKPLNWWRTHLPLNARGYLAKLWFWSMIVFVFMFWFSVAIAITGWPLVFFDANGTNAYGILSLLGYVSDVIMLLVVVAGFAYDIQRRNTE